MEEVKIPSIDIVLTTKTVNSENPIVKLTVRNCFYGPSIWEKIKTVYTWLRYNRDLTWKEYLDKPVMYSYEMGELTCCRSINVEKELEAILNEEVEKQYVIQLKEIYEEMIKDEQDKCQHDWTEWSGGREERMVEGEWFAASSYGRRCKLCNKEEEKDLTLSDVQDI